MRVKRRTGVATVIGTLIFVAILMTSVIPMYLTMKETDTIYNQRQAEMVKLDQDRQREQVQVIATPVIGTKNIKVEAINYGSNDVTMVRTWVNDEYFELGSAEINGIMIHPFERAFINNYTINPNEYPDPIEAIYDVSMTTAMGNVFNNEGPLIWIKLGTGSGGWGIDQTIINVLVKSSKNAVITLTLNYRSTSSSPWVYVTTGMVHVLKGASELKPFDITGFPHDDGELYRFTVTSGTTMYPYYDVVMEKDKMLYWVPIDIT